MNNDLGCMLYPVIMIAVAPIVLLVGVGLFKLAGLIIGAL